MPSARSRTSPNGAPPFGKIAAAGAVGFAGLGLVFFFLIIGALGLAAATIGLLVWSAGAIAVWRSTQIPAANPDETAP